MPVLIMKRPSSIFFLAYLLITSDYLLAQQTNIWYFGNQSGLSFNPVSGSNLPHAISNSAMIANEGTATVCDKNGAILFYTNGETIYNKNHQPMLNGTGLFGHNSAFQASVIVPVPGNDSLYYVFTADAYENSFRNGYRYNIVNTKRDNGKGEVITKNILLFAPSTERLTAARHANGLDVWVITNELNSNRFRSYLITCNGLQPTPVLSIVGDVLNVHPDMGFGAMKISPDGKQLCQTHFAESDIIYANNFFQLFDFNNSTGALSNAKKIAVPSSRYLACEYSPDSKLLYITQENTGTIDQFEATLSSPALIVSSRASINASTGFYGLQLGPDNKIYITRSGFSLSVISNPNIKGTGCTFELDNIPVTGRSGLNLPAFVNDLALNTVFNYTIMDSCAGAVGFNAQTTLPGAIYQWDFGDGTTSTQQNPLHAYQNTGQIYTVNLVISSPASCGTIEKSLSVFPGGISATASYDYINRCDSGFVRFTNTSTVFPGGNFQYLWDFGDGTVSTGESPVHRFPGSGTYDVKLKIITPKACLNDSVSRQLSLQLLDIQAPPDQTIDIGQTVQLSVTGGGTQFTWTPSNWLSNSTISNPIASPLTDITYVVSASNNSGCTDSDSVTIKVCPANDIYVPSGFTPNNDGLNDFFRPFLGQGFILNEFTVYNRWGQKVFFTSKTSEGWNGLVNGIKQPPGVFVWWIRAKNPDGKIINKKGTAILIR